MTSITLTRSAGGLRETLTLFTTRTPGTVDGGLMGWKDSRLKCKSTPIELTLQELSDKIEAEAWTFDAAAMTRFVQASESGQDHDPFEGIGGAA